MERIRKFSNPNLHFKRIMALLQLSQSPRQCVYTHTELDDFSGVITLILTENKSAMYNDGHHSTWSYEYEEVIEYLAGIGGATVGINEEIGFCAKADATLDFFNASSIWEYN